MLGGGAQVIVNTFYEKYDSYRNFFEGELLRYCQSMAYQPPVLKEGMQYSLLSGGKRIRPVLFFATLEALNVAWQNEFHYAIALECIHTYSLIHDDLPAMDNDDFRRGKLSNHKKFGEANAILAGDALLNEAYLLLLKGAIDEPHRRAAITLATYAGADGMIGGQSLDLLCEKRSADKNELQEIYKGKTGSLIAAPIVMAANIANVDHAPFLEFGINLGILFQMIDDILDVSGDSVSMGKTLGKDVAEDKLTCVKVYGLEQAKVLAARQAEVCVNYLNSMQIDTRFLKNIVDFVRNRKN